jgi:hypothetical protein
MLEDNVPAGTGYQVIKNYGKNIFFASLQSLKKGVGSGVGSRSVSQRYGFADPDPHQNVPDPQHWLKGTVSGANYDQKH